MIIIKAITKKTSKINGLTKLYSKDNIIPHEINTKKVKENQI